MDDQNGHDETPDLGTLADRLHDRLRATAERPVERSASRWLGEAEAVAGDAAGAGERAVICKRARQVEELLANVEETGDPAADERVAEARDVAGRILARC